MTVQDTSIEAYRSVLPEMSERKLEVVNTVKAFGPLCNRDIAALTGRPINEITPTVLSLREDGVLTLSHKGIYELTGRRVMFWKVA
ncbi:helix-turn-helix DNA binding domain protein [Mycobacterium phage BiancaTri92]|nr:helix-turn-helix DNA binding domain protein [Mycobacterium phage Leogania]QGJ90964.1 helix-turn-helix DNA binding domain protein [Mycobacterium phage BiancaTri92]